MAYNAHRHKQARRLCQVKRSAVCFFLWRNKIYGNAIFGWGVTNKIISVFWNILQLFCLLMWCPSYITNTGTGRFTHLGCLTAFKQTFSICLGFDRISNWSDSLYNQSTVVTPRGPDGQLSIQSLYCSFNICYQNLVPVRLCSSVLALVICLKELCIFPSQLRLCNPSYLLLFFLFFYKVMDPWL